MKLIALFLILSALAACNPNKKTRPDFNSIDFSYFDISPLSFTLKIDNQDSVFLKQNFSPDKRLSNDTTYKAVLTAELKKQLDSLMGIINFSKLDSVYETGHIDGDEYSLYIKGDTLKKNIKVHSMSAPKELEALKELFLKIRLSVLPADTTTHILVNPPKSKVQGNPKIFTLNDVNSNNYYLADSVNWIFQRGFIGRSPLVVIDGTAFKYQKTADTIMLPLTKNEILSIDFVNKNNSRLTYGKRADNGAIIINTTKKKSTNR